MACAAPDDEAAGALTPFCSSRFFREIDIGARPLGTYYSLCIQSIAAALSMTRSSPRR